MSDRFLPIDRTNAFPLTHSKELFLFDVPPHPPLTTTRVAPGLVAVRIAEDAAGLSEWTGDARSHAGDPVVARAVALLAAHERMRFDPADGSPLSWSEAGDVAVGASGAPVFPRIDPSVIGLVEHPEGGRILLGENARRPGYYSLVAGYMNVGESAEEAFAREVLEETGRRVDPASVRYVCSQPWALSGSLMLGFTARAVDAEAQFETDGELADIVWADRAAVAELVEERRLPRLGTIARRLIEDWVAEGAYDGEDGR